MTDTGNRNVTGHVTECRDGGQTPDVFVTNIEATGAVREGWIHSELGTHFQLFTTNFKIKLLCIHSGNFP